MQLHQWSPNQQQQQQRRSSITAASSQKGNQMKDDNCSDDESNNHDNVHSFDENGVIADNDDDERLPGSAHATSSDSCSSSSSSCEDESGVARQSRRQDLQGNTNNHNQNSNTTSDVREGDPASARRRQQQQKQHWCSHLIEQCQECRQYCGKLVNDPGIQLVMLILMVINALLMGVATFDFVTDSNSMSNKFDIVDQVFLVIFTIELALQFAYRGVYFVTDAWLLFDAVIILASWSFEKLQVLRCLRILRSLRLIARIDTLQAVVAALIDVGPKVTIILSLLILIMYIYAVLFTALFSDMYEQGLTDDDYFGDLGKTFLTLFQMVTLDWASVAWQVADVYYYSWYLFISFIVITGLILYSLVVAVVCDAVAMQGDEEEKNEIRKMATRIQELQQRVHDMSRQQEALLKILMVQHRHNIYDGGDHDIDDNRSDVLINTSSVRSNSAQQKQNNVVVCSEHWVGNVVSDADDEQLHLRHTDMIEILKVSPVDRH